MAIRFIDLCSGIGGFHSGLMATGYYECVGHAEIDKHALQAYAAIYGKVNNYGTIYFEVAIYKSKFKPAWH